MGREAGIDVTGGWLRAEDCRIAELRTLTRQRTDTGGYPHAGGVEHGVLVYDSERLRAARDREAVQAELARALLDGPGIVVLKRAFPDLAVVDRASDAFNALMAEERAAGAARGDHFARPGANDRLWNALDKLAVRAPDVFADYYSNDMLELAAQAWLGPGYQVTSQVNVVNPGGAAQSGHRDYHLGFLSPQQAAGYPAHVHRLSPLLTLQGAVAHCDMPVESGPTMYLPHSQKYAPGYLAWQLPEFAAYFTEHRVQLPLEKGDAVFFNPALFHAAGHNRSAGIRRMANLLQVSSAFGRAMESADREAMANAVFPVLLRRASEGASREWLRRVVAACADGYPFPTNLDLDPPVNGLAPPSQADTVWQAVSEGWSPERLRGELRSGAERRQSWTNAAGKRHRPQPLLSQSHEELTLRLGAYTACLHDMPLKDALGFLAGLGLDSAEINSGGFLPPVHLPIADLRSSETARSEYLALFNDAGVALTALNCNGNPLDPDPEGARQAGDIYASIEIAALLGVKRVVTMSGAPGSEPSSRLPVWNPVPWHSAFLRIQDYQWNEVAIPFWKKVQAFAADHDVKVCLEMHPGNVVFNPRTLERLATEIGATHVGAEMDPSHLFWQGIDPTEAVRSLGGLVYNAAAKDTRINPLSKVNGNLDDSFTRVAPDDPQWLSLGGPHSLSGWPAQSSWDFVAVGRGHDVSWWAGFLGALREVDAEMAVNIEHEDRELGQVEGLRYAARTLLRAARGDAGASLGADS